VEEPEGPPTEFELELFGVRQSVVEIGPSGAQRRWWPWLAGLAVVGVLVALISGVDSNSSTAPTTAPTAPTTPTTPPPATSPTVPTPAVATTVAAPLLPILPFGTPTDAVAYLGSADGGPFSLQVYDIDRGTVRGIDLGGDAGWITRTVDVADAVLVDGGEVVRVDGQGQATTIAATGAYGLDNAPPGRIVPGPFGGAWVRMFHPDGLALLDSAGHPVGEKQRDGSDRIPVGSGADLIGTSATGRPVIRAPDGSTRVVADDGTTTSLSSDPTGVVDAGRYASRHCPLGPAAACELVLHGDGPDAVVPPDLIDGRLQDVVVLFQPGGHWVAVVDGQSLNMWNPLTKARRVGAVDSISRFSRDMPAVAFLPSGIGLIASTSSGLVFVSTEGGVVGTPFEVAGSLEPPVLLGVGRRH
jgi:hypothetical protein